MGVPGSPGIVFVSNFQDKVKVIILFAGGQMIAADGSVYRYQKTLLERQGWFGNTYIPGKVLAFLVLQPFVNIKREGIIVCS